ncbi:DnaD domain protein [Anaerofilum sp. BX8]|uniref:DnaD domain protein n=1 Tax=Anaerofilum hominis TaxID=2763016 RepID=A0A923I889_9FIRM|nr:DnaD domain protein [Anaerofilum hominis]MBC5582100.1 DnaD domain protein [Anaerofilum hominis]
MEYQLLKNNGDAVPVPSLVLRRLAAASGDQLRVALAILRDGKVCPEALLAEFPALGNADTLEKHLIYWAGAGLLSTTGPAAAAPKRPLQKRPPRLSTREVTAAAENDPQVAVLITESQNLFGTVLNESDGNVLASLYLQDKLPVDLILTGIAHFVTKGNRSVRYIARVLLSWREEGIRTGADMERYLSTLAQREKYEQETAHILGVDAAGFTSSERTLIARWYEEYGYGGEMIRAASQRAGDKNTVRYLNAMLKKWNAKGYRSPGELIAEGPSNTHEQGRIVTREDDLLLREPDHMPKFKKRGER